MQRSSRKPYRSALVLSLMLVCGVLAAQTWGGTINGGAGDPQAVKIDDSAALSLSRTKGTSICLNVDGGNQCIDGTGKATFTGAVADATERYIWGYTTTPAGYTLAATVFQLGDLYLPGAVTITGFSARTGNAGTGTAIFSVEDFSATNICDCTFTCGAGNNDQHGTCTGTSGTGCTFAAGTFLVFLWARGGDSCTTTQPALHNVAWIGKYQ